MGKILRNSLLFLGALLLVSVGSFVYVTRYRVQGVAQELSPTEDAKVILQQIGDPGWPFGPVKGRVTLHRRGRIAAQAEILVSNDGDGLSAGSWQVEWFPAGVQVTISGSEQPDMQLFLHEDGRVDRKSLEQPDPPPQETPPPTEALPPDTAEWFATEPIGQGYAAIFTEIFVPQGAEAALSVGAKGQVRLVVWEDAVAVEYLEYDRDSANGACGLYVHLRCAKAADGSWSPSDAQMQNSYAYVYETGAVIASGKTGWADPGRPDWQAATGEA